MTNHTDTQPPRTGVIRGLVVLTLVAACRDRPPPPAAPVGPTIELSLDGAQRTIEVTAAVPLASVVDAPASTWIGVRADATDGRWLELATPATTYAGSELRLYLDHGRVALGVFPPVTPDMPARIAEIARHPSVSLTPLKSVDIVTKVETALAPLTIELDGKPVPIASDQLATLPVTVAKGARPQGWAISAVIALVAPGRQPRSVRIIGASVVTLDASALGDPRRLYLLKANQRGEYVFREWEVDGQSPVREVRRVTSIAVD